MKPQYAVRHFGAPVRYYQVYRVADSVAVHTFPYLSEPSRAAAMAKACAIRDEFNGTTRLRAEALLRAVDDLLSYPRGTYGHRNARIALVSAISALIDSKIALAHNPEICP